MPRGSGSTRALLPGGEAYRGGRWGTCEVIRWKDRKVVSMTFINFVNNTDHHGH